MILIIDSNNNLIYKYITEESVQNFRNPPPGIERPKGPWVLLIMFRVGGNLRFIKNFEFWVKDFRKGYVKHKIGIYTIT